MTYNMTATLPDWLTLELDCTLADGCMTIEGAGLDLCYALDREPDDPADWLAQWAEGFFGDDLDGLCIIAA